MKQSLTVGVRARFGITAINDMWSEFERQAGEDPGEIYFRVGEHGRWQNGKPYTEEVFVTIDEYPDGRIATMRMANEF